MKGYFSIGELATIQNISRQTLIFYDQIGLFKPAYVDAATGYRYYSIKQLDLLDTICIMKKIGFSLKEIKAYIQNYTLADSLSLLTKQKEIIAQKINELKLLKSRIENRLYELEKIKDSDLKEVQIQEVKERYLLIEEVKAPYDLDAISIATKKCFTKAFREDLPIYIQSGVIVPLKRILDGDYISASMAFLPIEKTEIKDVKKMPEGRCIYTYHEGDYLSIASSYQRLLKAAKTKGVKIISDSYEFAINDYLSTGDEREYVTKIMFYVE